ncbi:MAG: sulfite exporter TauE/SafE family protein [Armatimonadetes bacterium]|nr:sulfite exporter TauE/SafE family protein [Armatimonadota bacterium]
MLWWAKCFVVGALGGFLGGVFGVGGGIVMVPLLMYAMGLGIHDAKATSLALIFVVSIAGTIQHQRRGAMHVDWPIVLVAGIAAVFASAYGAVLSEKLPKVMMQRLFAALIILVAVRMLATTPSKPQEKPAPTPQPAVEQAH